MDNKDMSFVLGFPIGGIGMLLTSAIPENTLLGIGGIALVLLSALLISWGAGD